jgi:hypothetical protein
LFGYLKFKNHSCYHLGATVFPSVRLLLITAPQRTENESGAKNTHRYLGVELQTLERYFLPRKRKTCGIPDVLCPTFPRFGDQQQLLQAAYQGDYRQMDRFSAEGIFVLP